VGAGEGDGRGRCLAARRSPDGWNQPPHGQADARLGRTTALSPSAPGSMLDPFEPLIRRVLEEWPEIKAPRMTEILREHGYEGSVDVVKRRLRQLRPRRERPAQRTGYRPRPGAAARLGRAAHPPQNRWPRAALLRARRFAALLGRASAHFSFDMTLESFLEGHARIFDWLGGVTRECVYDNLRSVVAKRERDEVHWKPRFLHCAATTPFTPPPARHETPREKGSVEGAVRHLTTGFWPARRIGSLADLDEQYRDWRERVCNRRLHATGRFPVNERLPEERAALSRCRPRASTTPTRASRACRSTAICATGARSAGHPRRSSTSASRSTTTPTASGSATVGRRSPATHAATSPAAGRPRRGCGPSRHPPPRRRGSPCPRWRRPSSPTRAALRVSARQSRHRLASACPTCSES
jgi:transposase